MLASITISVNYILVRCSLATLVTFAPVFPCSSFSILASSSQFIFPIILVHQNQQQKLFINLCLYHDVANVISTTERKEGNEPLTKLLEAVIQHGKKQQQRTAEMEMEWQECGKHLSIPRGGKKARAKRQVQAE
jgi:hypothetical protein